MQLDPRITAVLIIDVQSALFGSEPPPYNAQQVLANINTVASGARQSGASIFVIQHDGSEEDDLVPNTPGWQLHPDLVVQPSDVRLRKTTCDAFYGTSLEEQLRRRKIEHLVLMGYATDFCIDSTLRNAVSKEFSVLVVADAHTTNDSEVLPASAIRDHHNYAWPSCTTPHPVFVCPAETLTFKRAVPLFG